MTCSALLTLSFTLRSAPRSCSSLTASRCPPRQAQCTAVQSSWSYSAVSWQGTLLPCVCSLPHQVPMLELNQQSPACSHLHDGDSTAPGRVPSPAVVLAATHPDAQTSMQLEVGFSLTRSLKSTVAPLSSSFCRISMCPSSEERCRAVRWNWGTGWHIDRWMHPPRPVWLYHQPCPKGPSHRPQAWWGMAAGLGGMAGANQWLPGMLPHHMCQVSHHLPETSQ